MKLILNKLIANKDLTKIEAEEVVELLATNKLTPAQAGAFLVALAMKGETVDEIIGLVIVMRRHMTKLNLPFPVLDTCGTGGDVANTFNVSTAAAFVVAAAGVKVAKHGNRSVSSQSGSMDVLEALGIKIDLSPEQVTKCISELGIGFMFAPLFHPAMKNIGPIRKELGVRTVFNFLGPLLNPAGATRQIIGVSSKAMAEKLGSVLIELGSERVIIVHSRDGLDEISLAASTDAILFQKNQSEKSFVIEPEKSFTLAEVKGGDAKFNAAIITNVLQGKGTSAQTEFVALNAAGALFASGEYQDFKSAKVKADNVIKSGEVYKLLEKVRDFTNRI